MKKKEYTNMSKQQETFKYYFMNKQNMKGYTKREKGLFNENNVII